MTGKDEEVAENTFAVCDAKTGVVHHIHSVVSLDGAKLATDSDAAAEALEFATATGDLRGQLRVVRVSADSLKRGTSYKLNVKAGTLEPIDLKSVRRPRERSAKKRSAKNRRAR